MSIDINFWIKIFLMIALFKVINIFRDFSMINKDTINQVHKLTKAHNDNVELDSVQTESLMLLLEVSDK